jgi:hypothetical protein
MHYKLNSGVEIKTENAAKPESQASQFLLGLLRDLPHVPSAFDYGCGKLRYQKAIADKSDTLAIVDSEIQLMRIQMIQKDNTSIREIFEHSNRVFVYNETQFATLSARFERGFCINVLSVIPSIKHRKQVLEVIRGKLLSGGRCLFVVQYRNSDFNRMRRLPNAKPWLDGFLIDSLRGYSFYGLISPQRLEAFLKRSGFRICEARLNEGGAYMWATPAR